MVVWIAVPRADLHVAHRGVGAGEGQVETGTVSTDIALLVSGTRNFHHPARRSQRVPPETNASLALLSGARRCHLHPRRSYRPPAVPNINPPLRPAHANTEPDWSTLGGDPPHGTREVNTDRRSAERNTGGQNGSADAGWFPARRIQ